MPRVAAVVVTYNRCALLLQCLEHLAVQDLRSHAATCELDVLVIDNASTDNTAYAVAEFAQMLEGVPGSAVRSLRRFNTGANLGGAGGFSYGMRVATEEGYDYLWIMDDDCLPEPGALAALLDAADKLDGKPAGAYGAQAAAAGAAASPAWGFLSSVVRWTDGSICQMNVQRHPLYAPITDFTPALQPATLASFVSLFVPAAHVREVGLPIAEFVIWSDDWEFTRRLSRRWPSYVVGESQVVHASANNGAGNIYTDVPERLDRYRYIYRNDCVLYRQEGLAGNAFLVARAAYHMLRVVASPVGNKAKRLGIIAASNLAGAFFNPNIEFPR